MTFKEEFEEKYPGEFNLIRCPRDKDLIECDGKLLCAECWNREIPKEKEKTTENLAVHTEQFICSKCELHLEDFTQQIYDEDEDETSSVEFEFLYCPGCGRKVESYGD